MKTFGAGAASVEAVAALVAEKLLRALAAME
jgi:hypothetical protein